MIGRAPLLLALGLALLAGTAAAHANLAGAEPAPNAQRVPVGLDEVVVRFSEAVDPGATTVEVLETESGEVRNAAAPTFFDGNYAVRVPLEPLRDGVHTVKWRALSTSDGHTTRGAFVFAVGSASLGVNPPPPAQFDESDYDPASVAREGFARAVFFGGLFLAVGMPLFGLVVLRGEPLSNRLMATAGVFGVLGGLAGFVTLQLLAQRLDFPLGQAIGTVAGTSFLRRAALVGLAGAVLLGALAVAPRRRAPFALAAVALGVAAIAVTSLGSHAAGLSEQRTLAVASDMLHLAMASIWIGGIVAFLHAGWGRSAPEVGRLIHRFSPLAVASVVALLATGTYASFLHIPRLADLWEAPYGRLVLAKILLMVPLLALGAYNQRVLGPRLEGGRTHARYFRRALQVEAVVMVIVIGLAGGLAASAPPTVADAGGGGGGAFDPPPAWEADGNTKRSHVVLQVRPDPPAVGPSNVTVIVHTADLPESTQVYVVFEAPDAAPGEEGELVLLDRVGEQDWAKEGTFFTSTGTWTLHVTIQRGSGFEPEKIAFEVPVGDGGGTASS